MTRNGDRRILLGALISALLAAGAAAANEDDWRIYAEETKGDVLFYDAARIESDAETRLVWTRIQYKNSVMGASSYQSRVEIDCAQREERTLQRTFFSDRAWEDPAMSTDFKPKRKRAIAEGSSADRLLEIVCAR